jgi:alkanesulfonate monooxygenase SsuD/methylene tetrahydromethanopterin reductase-like flavin-dependent oxidoreductase (luciferase family)
LRLGINLPFLTKDNDAPPLSYVGRRAKVVEDIGFDSIWIGDTISRGVTWPDPLLFLLAAAAGTKTIELGTAVMEVPLRAPVDLAQRFLTMHALTGGRFSAGVGAGSTKQDYDACGIDFEQRFKLLRSHMDLIRALCRGEEVGEANLHPWPATVGGPRMLIGAWYSGPWVKRAAQEYDGWLSSSAWTNFNTMKEGLQKYRDLGGKRAMVATIQVDLTQPEADLADDQPFHLRCGPKSAAERLQKIADIGFDDALIIKTARHTEADMTDEDLHQIRSLLPRDGTSIFETK